MIKHIIEVCQDIHVETSEQFYNQSQHNQLDRHETGKRNTLQPEQQNQQNRFHHVLQNNKSKFSSSARAK
jgi:hypothetical protein